MTKAIQILLAWCIAMSLGGCQRSEPAGKDIEIAYSALRISLPIFVAMEKGYFKEEGLNVKLVRFDTAQPMMQALVAGTVKVAGYCALPITYNAMLRGNKELYFITSLVEDSKHPLSYFLVPPNAPPGISVADFAGKNIGILPTVAFQKWLEQILIKNGLDVKSVHIVPVAPDMQQVALQSGQVDALFTADPVATAAVEKGVARKMSDDAIVPKYLGDPMLFGSFNVDKAWADQNPEVFAKLVRVLNKAAIFTNENPELAKQAMKPYVEEAQRSFVDRYPATAYRATKQSNGDEFQAMVDQYVRIGIIPKPIQVTHLVVK
jgi:NitT/TauT family transport system substrate-binding protein